jgi:hypothetical protein
MKKVNKQKQKWAESLIQMLPPRRADRVARPETFVSIAYKRGYNEALESIIEIINQQN